MGLHSVFCYIMLYSIDMKQSKRIGVLCTILVGLAIISSTVSMREFLLGTVLTQVRFGPKLVLAMQYVEPANINFRRTVRTYDSPYRQQLAQQYYTFHGAAQTADEYDYAKKIGLYLTANSVARTDFLDSILNTADTTDVSAIVLDVKGSYVYFNSLAPLATEFNRVRPLYDLPAIVQKAHEQGIYVIARYIAVKDSILAASHPETQVYNPQTNVSIGSLWVDPANALVLQYNAEILREVAASGIDEINLDYIRFGTEVPNYMVGLTGEQKSQRLLEFIKMARVTIDAVGNGTKLGVSTYAILGWNFPINFEVVGQDIPKFAKYVDVISPMAYPSTFALGAYYTPGVHPISRNYYLVYRTLKGYKELLNPDDHHKLRPWIQGYSMQPIGMRDQMQAVYDMGLCGFTVWSAGNVYANTITALSLVDRPLQCR